MFNDKTLNTSLDFTLCHVMEPARKDGHKSVQNALKTKSKYYKDKHG